MDNQRTLISTKLKIPQPRKHYIIRNELYHYLNHVYDYNAIIIKGGAGSGKTTLITSFLKENENLLAKWITLDENMNNILSFWSYFTEALKDTLGSSYQSLIELFENTYQRSNMERMLTFFINGLCDTEDILIVLDDFQWIKEESLIRTFEFFIQNIPENVHLILLTREEPHFYYASLELEEKLLYLDETNLKLSKEESIQFLKHTLRLSLSEETMTYMVKLAGGWIGGLQLIASSSQGKSEEEIYGLKFTNRLLDDYISHEIFTPLSENAKEFLIKTSILSYFTKEISEEMITNLDFSKIMEEVVNRNLLIIHVDEEKGIYRYHAILNEFLKSRFSCFRKEDQNIMHKRAALIFDEMEDFEECLNHLFLLKDYNEAMKVILKMPQGGVTYSYFDKIPVEIMVNSPDFVCQCFFYHYANFDVEKCNTIYNLLDAKLLGQEAYQAFRNFNIFVKDNITIEDLKKYDMVDVDNLSLNGNTKAFLLIKDASILLYQNKYVESLYLIEKAERISQDKNNPYLTFFSLCIKAQIYEEKGELNLCYEIYDRIRKILETEEALYMLQASYLVGISGVCLKQVDLASAKVYLENTEKLLKNDLYMVEVAYLCTSAIYCFLSGDKSRGTLITKELSELDTYSNATVLAFILKFILWHTDYQSEFGVKFVKDYENNRNQKSKKALGDNDYSHIMYADYLNQMGRAVEALEILDAVLKKCRKEKVKFTMIEAALLKIIIVKEKENSDREVLNLFHEAVYHCCDNRIILPFWFEKELTKSLVKQFQQQIERDFSQKEKAFIYQDILGEKENIQIKSELLSSRELEVLKEISTGATNKEIAERLFISISTVKTHIISIYSKLQVNSRVLAIDEGMKRGLL